jgi:hypothetical protein
MATREGEVAEMKEEEEVASGLYLERRGRKD